VEIAFDILQYCNDVSEFQMVAILDHFLSKSSALSIAVHLGKLSSHAFKFLPVDKGTVNRLLSSGEKKKIHLQQEIGPKLILAGTTVLVELLLDYSDFNEALLRDAIADMFGEEQLCVVARLLTGLLSRTHGDTRSKCAVMQKRKIKWLSAITDVLLAPRSDLSIAKGALIQKAVTAERVTTERVVALQHVVAKAAILARSGKRTKEDSNGIPAYQVERLVF
jgi:hypothetical protein